MSVTGHASRDRITLQAQGRPQRNENEGAKQHSTTRLSRRLGVGRSAICSSAVSAPGSLWSSRKCGYSATDSGGSSRARRARRRGACGCAACRSRARRARRRLKRVAVQQHLHCERWRTCFARQSGHFAAGSGDADGPTRSVMRLSKKRRNTAVGGRLSWPSRRTSARADSCSSRGRGR